jgi:hypothetical protein
LQTYFLFISQGQYAQQSLFREGQIYGMTV